MAPARSGGRASVDLDPGGRVVTRARAIDDGSVLAALDLADAPRVHWAGRDGRAFTGVGAAATITATGAERFDAVRAAAESLFDDVDHEGPPATRPRLFGGFAFDAAEDAQRDDVWASFPDALFVLPELLVVRGDDRTWLAATDVGEDVAAADVEARLDEATAALADRTYAPTGNAPGVRETHVSPDRSAWIESVERAVDRIADGELEKLVLATEMDAVLDGDVDVAAVLEQFASSYPDCYRLLVQPTADAAFFGPPPERLVRLSDGEVRTEALAGSIERGDTPEDDARLARSLRDDAKRRHEQQLVVDAIREQLSSFGTVTEHERTVRSLATIQHLRTPITATLDEPAHVLDLVAALHPTPAVGGLPRDAALRAIRETEAFDRGWYAAPVGWVDADGDGEFTVAIRTAVASGDRARLFAGNGIVADSDPASEWAEIEPKYRPILDALE